MREKQNGQMNKSYSVLMSVYYKEKPEYLRLAMESMFNQTIPPNDFVLVCDGPLTEELDVVIDQMQEQHKNLCVVRLKENAGLAIALNAGMASCQCELVARMDSDDISMPDRCEQQLAVFEVNPEVAVLSGTVLEFQDNTEHITGMRKLPSDDKALERFSRRRCPFNHPAVMFRKSNVEAVGGYLADYPLFEDYYLWIRLLQHNEKGYNLAIPLLKMRTSYDSYLRRGGITYARTMLRFYYWMLSSGWIGIFEYIFCVLPHVGVCLLPNELRRGIYRLLHSSAYN